MEFERSDEISDDLIEMFIEKVVVEKDRFKWKLNFLTDIYNFNGSSDNSNKEKNNDIYFSTIIITNDDVKKYRKRLKTCGLERVKKLQKDIVIDLFI